MSRLCPNWPIFELIGLLLKFESLNFSGFSYYKRQTDNSGPVADSLVFFIVIKFVYKGMPVNAGIGYSRGTFVSTFFSFCSLKTKY